VALPEVPLLAVLPGTGGLTRVTDKRKVRRDRADVFCSLEEGVRGKRRWTGGWWTSRHRPTRSSTRRCRAGEGIRREVGPAVRCEGRR
jgi:hypothetical protein